MQTPLTVAAAQPRCRAGEIAEQEARATAIARTCRAWTVIASAAGPVGESYPESCGTSGGLAVTRAGRDVDDMATLVPSPQADAARRS